MTKLDVSKCTALETLICNENSITELDLSKNKNFNEYTSSLSNQRVKALETTLTLEGCKLDLHDYVSNIKNIADVWGDFFVNYNQSSGIVLCDGDINTIVYTYNTHSSNGALMSVVIKSPLRIGIFDRTASCAICDMDERFYYDSDGNSIKEENFSSEYYSQFFKAGFTADGNSRLIIRAQTDCPGHVTFSLTDDIGATFEQLTNRTNKSTGSLRVATTELNSELYQASAVLVAPESFPNNKKISVR